VAVSRYADHQPLYRQAQIMARQGVIIDRSTLAFWMGYAAAEIAPVVTRLGEMLLAPARIFADETVVPVLDPGRGRTKQGYFWAIARDDRPWGGGDPPAVVYNYAPGRGHAHADALLGGYRGILQCDGYGAYKTLVGSRSEQSSITLAFCWSHAPGGSVKKEQLVRGQRRSSRKLVRPGVADRDLQVEWRQFADLFQRSADTPRPRLAAETNR
jgi:transposase